MILNYYLFSVWHNTLILEYNMNELLRNKNEVIKMLEGSYRKLKSYFYYNKNMIFMRKKLANFEMTEMNREFEKMADYLLHPRKNACYLESLIDQISFYVLPKKFISSSENEIRSNIIDRNKKVTSVNFFVDAPIQIHILDTLWTVCLGKIVHDEKILSTNCYANKLKNLYKNNYVDFYSNRLFEPYFNNYAKWRNKSFEVTERNYNNGNHSILISIDIKSYYYSINLKFRSFDKLFSCSKELKKFNVITKAMQQVYIKYTKCVSKYSNNISITTQTTSVLPIGLLSSMLIANVYLSHFDKTINSKKCIKSYGRYVDDMIFVFSYNDLSFKSNDEIINDTLIKNNIINRKADIYYLAKHKNLKIQKTKINIIHFSPNGSRSIFEYYNKHIKIIPSQTNIIPWKELDFPDFEEAAYFHDNMSEHVKIREIGKINTNAFEISKYFSSYIYNKKSICNVENIKEQKDKIYNFFSDSQAIEFYNNWINLFYFYILFCDKSDLKRINSNLRKFIRNIDYKFLNDEYKNKRSVIARLKRTLNLHLEISYYSALAIRIDYVDNSKVKLVSPYIRANLFNHHLVSFPLINYIDFKNEPINLINISLSNISKLPKEEIKLNHNHKLQWSPRFIHIDEFYQYLFITRATNGNNLYLNNPEVDTLSAIYKKYCDINYIYYNPKYNPVISKYKNIDNYRFQRIEFADDISLNLSEFKVTVANFNLDENYFMVPIENPRQNLSYKNNQMLADIFKESYDEIYNKQNSHLIVMPEGTLPIEWLSDIVTFSKKSQIAIIAGLQYIVNENQAYNYLLHIFPFQKRGFKSAFVFLREKNDYSPLEKLGLAKYQKICKDSEMPNYQIFDWKRLKIGSMLCFEFTDIKARSLFKGSVDLLVSSEFNKDTSYFAAIIESSVKDLHTTIVQSNTSIYGDSRITCPYDRNNRNIVQIKGGINNNSLIGSININRIREYELKYYDNLNTEITSLLHKKGVVKTEKETPKIAKLPAKYKYEK